MKEFPLAISTLLFLLLIGCASYEPTEEDYRTNYVEDQIYILQQDVVLKDNGFIWHATIDNPRYYLSDQLYDARLPRVLKGTRVQYKKIIFEDHPTMGPMFDPVGVLLDPPYSGKPVSLTFISNRNKLGEYGYSLNPNFLDHIQKQTSSSQSEVSIPFAPASLTP